MMEQIENFWFSIEKCAFWNTYSKNNKNEVEKLFYNDILNMICHFMCLGIEVS